MPYQISPPDCTACGTCADECPQGAVQPGNPYRIDAEACIDCGACEIACPNGAIKPAR